MCQQTIGKVISVKDDKVVVEIEGKLKEMQSPFIKVENGDMVICAANYIIEKDESGIVCR